MLITAVKFAYAQHNNELLANVTIAIKQVGPLIASIVQVAATLSELDRLKMNHIFKTCCSTNQLSTSINLQSVIVRAKSVSCVMQLVSTLKKALSDLKVLIPDSQSTSQVTKNPETITNVNELPISNTKRIINQRNLKEILLHTDFEEVLYSNSKSTTTTEKVTAIKTNLVTNRHSTSDFLKKFIDYNITSMRQFNFIIKQDLELRSLYVQLPYNLTNQIISKGILYL